jgi:hypothetical protein
VAAPAIDDPCTLPPTRGILNAFLMPCVNHRREPALHELVTAYAVDRCRNKPDRGSISLEPVDYSTDLVPATPLRLPAVPQGSFPPKGQSQQTSLLWVEEADATAD